MPLRSLLRDIATHLKNTERNVGFKVGCSKALMKVKCEKIRVQSDISYLINEKSQMSLFLQGSKKAQVILIQTAELFQINNDLKAVTIANVLMIQKRLSKIHPTEEIKTQSTKPQILFKVIFYLFILFRRVFLNRAIHFFCFNI